MLRFALQSWLLLLLLWCGSSSSLSLYRQSSPSPMTMMSDWGLPPPSNVGVSLSGKVALGVDYGTRNVGVGVSAGWSPRPLTVIKHPGNDTSVAGKLVTLARGELAELIVVGMPFDKDGTETYQAQLTREFARLLASLSDERGGPNVVLVDERFSSAEAQARMQHEKRSAMLARLDEESACVILEGYFADGGAGAEAVRPDPEFLAEVRRNGEVERRRAAMEERLAAENAENARKNAEAAAEREDELAEAYRVDPTFDVASLDLEGEVARLAAELDSR